MLTEINVAHVQTLRWRGIAVKRLLTVLGEKGVRQGGSEDGGVHGGIAGEYDALMVSTYTLDST